LKKDLRRFKRVGVTAFHVKNAETQWTIEEFVNKDANEATFPDPDDKSRRITIAQYFKKKYNLDCTPNVPVVRMTKKIRGEPVYLPMDWLRIDVNQRYNTKLSDTQTSQMIKVSDTFSSSEALTNTNSTIVRRHPPTAALGRRHDWCWPTELAE
jgi:eukaryotic translation initiation factor 2C